MGTCSCHLLEKATNTNFGGRLRYVWSDGHKTAYFDTPPGTLAGKWCNPLSCSNKACTTKSCAQARYQFCTQHGYYCPSLGRKVCWGDKCPGGVITCLEHAYDVARYGDLPLCGDTGQPSGTSPPPGNKPPATKPGGSSGGPCRCGCEFPSGSWQRWANCLGYDWGNFFTDAFRSGGQTASQNMPLMLMLGAGVLLVLLLKK